MRERPLGTLITFTEHSTHDAALTLSSIGEQAASSAAYALGPVLGALLAARLGFAALLRLLGAANLLYAAWLARHLARHPLAPPPPAHGDEEIALKPAAHPYAALR